MAGDSQEGAFRLCRFPLLAAHVLAMHASALRVLNLSSSGGYFRQQLRNDADLQYSTEIRIGGQTLDAMLDTGSFELLVFGQRCSRCGNLNGYDRRLSAAFRRGSRTREHSYGSGTCVGEEARDSLSLGPFSIDSLPIWEAVSCQMPLLEHTSFNVVIGLGPPGQAAFVATRMLDEIGHMEADWQRRAQLVPEDVQAAKARYLEDLAAAPSRPSLLELMGVRAFSACLGRMPGSPGWLVWNEPGPHHRLRGVRAPVLGKSTWSLRLEDVALLSADGSSTALGCESGCAAVLDTGTSLLGVPSDVHMAVRYAVAERGCLDAALLPDLVMTLGGSKLRFPPRSYLGSLVGNVTPVVQRFLHTETVGIAPRVEAGRCQLLLLDLGNKKTAYGPMYVLGQPFFREYYTTFDLGQSPRDRSIYIDPDDGHCRPASRTPSLALSVDRESHHALLRVDATKLQMPPLWLTAGQSV